MITTSAIPPSSSVPAAPTGLLGAPGVGPGVDASGDDEVVAVYVLLPNATTILLVFKDWTTEVTSLLDTWVQESNFVPC